MNERVVLSAEGLVKRWPNGRVALQGASLSIHQNEVLAIVGANGCGKSTLLSILAGLESIDAGTMRFDGVSVRLPRQHGRLSTSDEQALCAYRTRVGLVFQNESLFPHFSVGVNCAIGPRYGAHRGGCLGAREAADRARAALARVGMQDFFAHRVIELSGGQQQRVAIARALANEPEVLLLDEPTSALDPQRTREIGALVRDLASARAMTLVVVTHDLQLTRDIADRVALIHEGRVEFVGKTAAFFSGRDASVARFLDAEQTNESTSRHPSTGEEICRSKPL